MAGIAAREPQRVATFILITPNPSPSLSSFIISFILFFLRSSILDASLLASPVIPSCTRRLFISVSLSQRISI